MTRVALVACSSRKTTTPAPAERLYLGALFRASLPLARAADGWAVLSARHGLVDPGDVLDPYDETLVGAPRAVVESWVVRVRASLSRLRPCTFVVLAGAAYRGPLSGACVHPCGIERLGIGSQVRRLREMSNRQNSALVVGVAPSASAGRKEALVGFSSGSHLERLLGLQPGELGLVADTANLYPEHPGGARSGNGDAVPPALALRTAASELDLRGYDRVVLCGRAVAGAFGFDGEPLSVAERGGVRFLLLPHPSSVSRWWNERANRDSATLALREFMPDVRRDLLSGYDR